MIRRKILAAALAASLAPLAGSSTGIAGGPLASLHCDTCESCNSGTCCDAYPYSITPDGDRYYAVPGDGSGPSTAPFQSRNGRNGDLAAEPFQDDAGMDLGAPPSAIADDFGSLSIPQPAATSLAFAAPSAMNTIGGYIDDALVRSRVRLRYDSVDGGDSDRAEFLYATYANAGGNTPGGANRLDIGRLDFEEGAAYFEFATSSRFSAFVELGVRFNDVTIHPTPAFAVTGDPQAEGLSDMNAGFKFALRNCPDDVLTFQFKTIIPTGYEEDALGTGHVSLMPGILFQRRASSRLTFFGELHDWIAVGATRIFDAAGNDTGHRVGGNVLRYGLGAGYDLYSCGRGCNAERLTAVSEVVGWTVLNGFGYRPSDLAVGPDPPFDMDGDTIVNIKVGARYTVGRDSLYAGYGFAVTDDVWYDDIIRVQYERFVW